MRSRLALDCAVDGKQGGSVKAIKFSPETERDVREIQNAVSSLMAHEQRDSLDGFRLADKLGVIHEGLRRISMSVQRMRHAERTTGTRPEL